MYNVVGHVARADYVTTNNIMYFGVLKKSTLLIWGS